MATPNAIREEALRQFEEGHVALRQLGERWAWGGARTAKLVIQVARAEPTGVYAFTISVRKSGSMPSDVEAWVRQLVAREEPR